MKYIGALIFAVCASLYGFHKSRELKERTKGCNEILIFVRATASYIDKLKLPLSEIYRRLMPSSKLAKSLIGHTDPLEAVAESGIFTDEETTAKLIYFLENIGGGFLEEELALCNELEEFAERKQAFYDKEYQSKSVLYRSLGLIAGLAVMIVIA